LQLIADAQKGKYPGCSRLWGAGDSGFWAGGTRHTPPGAHLVAELIEDMCDYVNDRWHEATAIHIASYLMWRLNWIHPFADGNGRTARMTSYVAMSVKIGRVLAGTPTIPEQIVENFDGQWTGSPRGK
jgi:Fic family protein